MSENSKIGWCDHTFNRWIGCTKVSPGCTNCYAETLDERRFSRTLGTATPDAPVSHWGKGAPRHGTKTAGDVRRWNRTKVCKCCGAIAELEASKCETCHGTNWRKPRVFTASLSDWLDPEAPAELLADLLDIVAQNTRLTWMMLTKRPEAFTARLEAALASSDADTEGRRMTHNWLKRIAPAHAWLGISAEDQARYDERWPILESIPATLRFVSAEPLLGPIDLKTASGQKAPDWLIVGGESGDNFRRMQPDWAEALVHQAHRHFVPTFFKQWSHAKPGGAGNLIGGETITEFPS